MGWFDSEYGSIRIGSAELLLRGDINIGVRSLLNVADPNTELREQGLAPLGLGRLIERDALKLLSVERSHEATAKRYYELWADEIKRSLENRLLPSLEESVKRVKRKK